jgi:hypothetical protein
MTYLTADFRLTPYPLSAAEPSLKTWSVGGEGDEVFEGDAGQENKCNQGPFGLRRYP